MDGWYIYIYGCMDSWNNEKFYLMNRYKGKWDRWGMERIMGGWITAVVVSILIYEYQVCVCVLHSQQIGILWYLFVLLVVSFAPYPISELFCFWAFVFYSFSFFFVALTGISREVFFFLLCSRTRYASTWFAYLESSAFGFSLYHCLCPQNLYLSRMKNQNGQWVTADVVG